MAHYFPARRAEVTPHTAYFETSIAIVTWSASQHRGGVQLLQWPQFLQLLWKAYSFLPCALDSCTSRDAMLHLGPLKRAILDALQKPIGPQANFG